MENSVTEQILAQKPIVASFRIDGLFGDRDVVVDFESPVTILLADNGSGKTTILNIIWALLTNNSAWLSRYEFEKATVVFTDGNTFTRGNASIDVLAIMSIFPPEVQEALKQIDETELLTFWSGLLKRPHRNWESFPQSIALQNASGIDRQAWDVICRVIRGYTPKPNKASAPDVKLNFPFEIHYLPTYRRIEEDIESLGISKKTSSKVALAQFGMSDVKKMTDELCKKISRSSLEAYSKTSGQVLSQLVDGISLTDDDYMSIHGSETLAIVLERLGANIGEPQRERIKELVRTGRIQDFENQPLAYILSKLVKIYDEQKELDASLRAFERVCNAFLDDKKVIYDENRVTLTIVQEWDGRSIQMSQLSSGEKQIISLFAKLYIEAKSELAMFIDEPELSLSMDWQRKLLPEVLESGRCKFLIATTHSAFTFDNDLDRYARDLNSCIHRRARDRSN